MTIKPASRSMAGISLTLGLSSAAYAQIAPQISSASEEAVLLSPFEVNTSRDVGFVAARSLAGGRLASDLKDTAVAYSVLTREFLDAVAITDLAEATKWTVNTSSTQDDASNALIARGVSYNSRGVGAGSQYRDFFPSTFNPDSYNVERFDYARGPNAILFGPGGIGGTSNVVTKQAALRKHSGQIGVQLGSWARRRGTFDVNVPVGDLAALRLNAVHQDADGWQQNVFDHRRGLHLAGVVQPLPKLRLNFDGEWGRKEQNVAISSLLDILSAWDGVTTFAVPTAAIPAALATSSSAQRYAPPHLLISPANTGNTFPFDYGNDVRTRGGAQAAGLSVGGVPVASTLTPSIANFGMQNALNLPGWEARLKNIFQSAVTPQATKDFFRDLGLNRSTFTEDLDVPNVYIKYRTFGGTARFHVSDRLFVEASGNYIWQHFANELTARSFMQQILIDLTQTLPNGQRNPGFLQPFSENLRTVHFSVNESENYRVAAAYVLNDTRVGSFTFSANAGGQNASSTNRRLIYSLAGLTSDPRGWGAAATINGVAVDPRFYYRYYWTINTPGNRPLSAPLAVDSGPVAVNINGQNITGRPAWLLEPAGISADIDTTSELNYAQTAMNWKFWKNRVNVLAAGRFDRYVAKQKSPYPLLTDPAYGPGWDGFGVPFRPAAPPNYFQLSADDQARYSAPSVEVRHGTYAVGAVVRATNWLSPFADFGTSFNPNGAGIDVFGRTFEPRTSKGWDAGLRFTLFGGRVTATAGRYSGRESGQQINVGSAAGLTFALDGQINNIITARPVSAGTAGNVRGVPAVPRAYNDRRDLQNEGFEVELLANVGKGWRVMANAARAEASQTNAYADSRAYLEQNDAALRQILADAGVTIGANNQAALNAAASPEAPNAAAGWNNLQAFKSAVITGKQKVNRLPKMTANAFVDYTFPSGRLRGLTIGAGVNYRGREIIGNYGADLMVNPANPTQAIDNPALGPLDYVYGSSYYTGTLTAGYRLRMSNSASLALNLRVDNVFDYKDPRYYNTVLRPPGGDLGSFARVTTPYQFFYLTPRNFTLTATLRF
ncbi:MAG: hypothetical protein EXS37_16765 [Opitutus sp.]|nr:hypothetical protein [Opitutus sp.]